MVLTGCSGQGATRDEHASAAARQPAAPRVAIGGACRRMLVPFLDSMDGLRRKLAVGLAYQQYLHELQRLRHAYAAIPSARLPLGCLLVAGTPAERALNLYTDAANDWGDCLTTVACDTATVEPALQGSWSRASRLLSSAQAAL